MFQKERIKMNDEKDNMIVTTSSVIGEFKGKPVLSLTSSSDSARPTTLSFGLAKARLILAEIDSIRTFVVSDGKTLQK